MGPVERLPLTEPVGPTTKPWAAPRGVRVAGFVVTTILFAGWVMVGGIHALGHLAAGRLLGVPVRLKLGLGGGPHVRIGWFTGVFAVPRLEVVQGWRAALYLAAGPITSLVAAFLLIAVPFTGAAIVGEPDRQAIVAHVAAGSAAERAGLRAGDHIVAVDGAEAAWWSDARDAIEGEGAHSLTVERGGARVDLRLDVQAGERSGVAQQAAPPVVESVHSGSPADAAGIQSGDRVVRIDGTPISDWSDLVAAASASEGRPLALELVRDGAPLVVTVTPTFHERAGPDGRRGPMIGVSAPRGEPLPWENRTWGVGAAVALGSARAVEVLNILVATATTPASLGGPVALVRAVGDHAEPRWGWLKVMGMVLAPGSLMLACYNLLPLAWSDGFTAVAEVLRRLTGRRLPHWPFVFATVGSVGSLIAFVFVMDILLWLRSAGG